MKKKLKRFSVDIAGYTLILLGILLGWLPGPGGIPLILAGLGLLSVHNHWAKRILEYIKENGLKVLDYIFPENKAFQAAHDVLASVLALGAVYIVFTQSGYVWFGAAFALTALAVVDFLYNRNRISKLKRK